MLHNADTAAGHCNTISRSHFTIFLCEKFNLAFQPKTNFLITLVDFQTDICLELLLHVNLMNCSYRTVCILSFVHHQLHTLILY